MNRALWIGALALLLIGCDQKTEAPAGASTNAKAAGSAAPSGAPAAQAANDDDLPTEADFEAEAEKEITADNLDAELDKLDKEIGK